MPSVMIDQRLPEIEEVKSQDGVDLAFLAFPYSARCFYLFFILEFSFVIRKRFRTRSFSLVKAFMVG